MTGAVGPATDVLQRVPETWLQRAFTATAWDPTLKRSEHAELARRRVLGADHAWAYTAADGQTACAWMSARPWDTEFFGIEMALMGLEGDVHFDAVQALLPMVFEQARRDGVRHLRTPQRAGSPETLHALQSHGFQLRWASVQIACDTRTLAPTRATPPPELRFVDGTPDHLPSLLAAARRVGPYNWPEFDEALAPSKRSHYVAQRIENCLLTPFADQSMVALWRDRPVGLHASATCTHEFAGEIGQIGRDFAYVRETFVAPDCPPHIGAHLLRTATRALGETVRYATGRVRLDGLSMLNTSLTSGYRIVGNNGRHANQEVLHFHVHIFGGRQIGGRMIKS
ncbi:MAG: HIT domain-containing protein [Myxococcota bacterium]|nr:HIT domain-containing protein [Myxococcota bacterium]